MTHRYVYELSIETLEHWAKCKAAHYNVTESQAQSIRAMAVELLFYRLNDPKQEAIESTLALNMTTGELAVWRSAFTVAMDRLRETFSHSPSAANADHTRNLAISAADEAWGTVTALREIVNSNDFGSDVRQAIED
jgi:hypothetical protein